MPELLYPGKQTQIALTFTWGFLDARVTVSGQTDSTDINMEVSWCQGYCIRANRYRAGCGVYSFTFVRLLYDFNSSSRGLIETNPYGNYAAILQFPCSHWRVLRRSWKTCADRSRYLPLCTQMREYTKLCGFLDLNVYVTGLVKKMHDEWNQNHGSLGNRVR